MKVAPLYKTDQDDGTTLTEYAIGPGGIVYAPLVIVSHLLAFAAPTTNASPSGSWAGRR